MTAAMTQPGKSANWTRDHRQDLADLVKELHNSGDDQLARLAEQALAASKK